MENVHFPSWSHFLPSLKLKLLKRQSESTWLRTVFSTNWWTLVKVQVEKLSTRWYTRLVLLVCSHFRKKLIFKKSEKFQSSRDHRFGEGSCLQHQSQVQSGCSVQRRTFQKRCWLDIKFNQYGENSKIWGSAGKKKGSLHEATKSSPSQESSKSKTVQKFRERKTQGWGQWGLVHSKCCRR